MAMRHSTEERCAFQLAIDRGWGRSRLRERPSRNAYLIAGSRTSSTDRCSSGRDTSLILRHSHLSACVCCWWRGIDALVWSCFDGGHPRLKSWGTSFTANTRGAPWKDILLNARTHGSLGRDQYIDTTSHFPTITSTCGPTLVVSAFWCGILFHFAAAANDGPAAVQILETPT